MPDRHGRDPGVAEIVRYFDQPEHSAWHLLTDKEAKVLHDEIAKCAHGDTGYPYIARNYYWITTKAGSDVLLQFKETQEMVWETVRYLRLRSARGVRILIIKGRQLFVTSVGLGLLAYETQFNPNNRGLLVSYDETHAGKLFQIVLHIYDQLPWWLRPMIGTRLYMEGIHLVNPDPELRRLEPGLNSRITVQGATQSVGVSEGETVNTALISEFGSYDPSKARKIIIGDFRWALPEESNTTAILETRVQKASRFAERFWESQVELGDMADWYPLFIPIFFDRSHFIAPRIGWKPAEPELAVKARAAEEWRACTNCGQLRPANFGGSDLSGVQCRDCKVGMYAPYALQDGQMFWMQGVRMNAEKLGDTAMVEMQQSLATNPQEAFAHVTETVFSKAAREWVARTTRGECLAQGYMAADGVFHAPRRVHGEESEICWAQGCRQNHAGDTQRLLKIWTPPQRGVQYAASVDVGSGKGGKHDYSTVWVNKLSAPPEPDIQVAMYRCNTISAWHLADVANSIGRWYNNALMVVDYTNYQTVGDRLLNELYYPNLYQWVQEDAVKQQTNRWHWVWNNKNKESGWTVLDGWLTDHSLVAKDPVFAKELRHFQRLPDGSLGAPDSKETDGVGDEFEKIHDDTVMTAIQLVIASRQRNPRRAADALIMNQPDGVRQPGEWSGSCAKCQKKFPAQAPCERDRCPFCGSVWLSWRQDRPEGKLGVGPNAILGFEWDQMAGTPGYVRDRSGPSDEFSFGPGPSMGQE